MCYDGGHLFGTLPRFSALMCKSVVMGNFTLCFLTKITALWLGMNYSLVSSVERGRPHGGNVIGRETAVWLAALGWLAAVAAGFGVWERYDTTAGAAGSPPAAAGEPPSGQWRLTLFAHPHCPCTRASLAELAEALRDVPDLFGRVVFVRPPEAASGWERGASWDAAENIPGVEVACDAGGAEAQRAGAETSGQAVLTDPAGNVVFRGGLTRARGRSGDGPGRRAVRDWVGRGIGPGAAPVYGCPLFTDAE